MGDHLERLAAVTAEHIADGRLAAPRYAEADVTAALDELKQLRAQRLSLDGQVFISGWYAHAEACASLGWDVREAAWRKYREEMTATLVKADAALQRVDDGARAKFAADMDHLRKSDPTGAQWVEHILAEHAEQQPARDTTCVCGCGRPADDTDMCHCPTPCPCEPDCAFCLVPDPMQEPARGVADGGAK